MTQLATDNLAKLICDKRDHLLRLREFGVRQQALIDSGDMAGLLRTIAAKQHLIGGLQQIEAELNIFRDEDPDGRTWRCSDDRNRCRTVADECRHLLQDVLQLERENEIRMQTRRDDTARRLQDLNTAGVVQGAYARQAGNVARPAAEDSGTSALSGPHAPQAFTANRPAGDSIDLVSEG